MLHHSTSVMAPFSIVVRPLQQVITLVRFLIIFTMTSSLLIKKTALKVFVCSKWWSKLLLQTAYHTLHMFLTMISCLQKALRNDSSTSLTAVNKQEHSKIMFKATISDHQKMNHFLTASIYGSFLYRLLVILVFLEPFLEPFSYWPNNRMQIFWHFGVGLHF